MRRRPLVFLLAAATALLAAAPASATLVFDRFTKTQSVWVANDDGSGQRRVAAGSNPFISPDGRTVFYSTVGDHPQLRSVPAAGGAARTLARNVQYGPTAVSRDGATVVVTTGRINRPQRLVLVTVATGAARTIATGFFTGASFSPAGDQLAYGRARSEQSFSSSDVWIVPVAGGAPRNLTSDGHSQSPVWGPTQIAFTRWARPTGRYAKVDGPKYNLSLINPDGSAKRALTNDRVPFLLAGLTPTAWSADGTRLLAQFGGQDTSYAVAVDPVNGAERVIGPKGESGLMATALSADGTTVLGRLGPLDDFGNVVTMPYAGGAASMLARKASNPAWSGLAP